MAAKTERSTRDLTRLNVNLNQETADALDAITESRNISYTEAVRRAIAVYKYIEDEEARGHSIQAVDPENNRVRELVLI